MLWRALLVLLALLSPQTAEARFGRGLGLGLSFKRPRLHRVIVVCGDGLIAGAEACDDGALVAGDGCSATCAIETGFGCGGAPSVCHLLYASVRGAKVQYGNGSNLNCGTTPQFWGASRLKVEWRWRTNVYTNICATTGNPWFDIDAGATNSIIRVVCFDDNTGTDGEELDFEIGNGTTRISCLSSGLNLRTGFWHRFAVDVNLSASTVTLYALGATTNSLTAIPLSCGTLPAAFDSTSVTAQLEISPLTSVTNAMMDDIVMWVGNTGPASLADWRDYWGDGVNREGEWLDPRTYGDPSIWLTFGDAVGDGTNAINVATVTNGAVYTYSVGGIAVSYTAGGSATALEIRDGLIAQHAVVAAANPGTPIAGSTASVFDGDSLTIAGAPFTVTEADAKLTTTVVVTDVMGHNSCTGSLSEGFVTTQLPIRSRIDSDRFGSDYRAFTITNGTEESLNYSAGLLSNEFVQSPSLYRYGRNALRTVQNNGSDLEQVESRIHYGNSLNLGVDWFWGNGPGGGPNDYPWSTPVESIVEPSQAPVLTNFNGNNQGYCNQIQSQDDGQDGSAFCSWRQVYSTSPLYREAVALASNWHLDTMTWAPDRDGGANEVNIFPTTSGNNSWNRSTGQCVELPNGDALCPTWGADTSGACTSGKLQIRLWRSTGTHAQDESWAAESIPIDGCNSSPSYAPQFSTVARAHQAPSDGTPSIHGRVYLFARAASLNPPGGTANNLGCLYTDTWASNPASTSPAWKNCSDGSGVTATSGIDWTNGITSGSNTAIRAHVLSDGVLVLGTTDAAGKQNKLAYSTDRGATFATLDVGVDTTGFAYTGAFGLDVMEVSGGRLGIMEARASGEERRNFMIWHDVADSVIPAGPLTWSNAGGCEVNGDASETDEYLRWGVYPELQGRARNAIAFRFRDTDGGADEVLLAQWGAAGGDQSFRLSRLSSGAVRMELGAYLCETSATLSLGVLHEIGVRYNGATPALLLDVDGGNIACDQNVTGTVPSTWAVSTARMRWGIDYDDSAPCTSCFFDELALWDAITFDTAAKSAACLGTDLRTCNVDADTDNDGTADASDTDDDNDGIADSWDRDDDNDGILDATDPSGVSDTPLGYVRCEGENAGLSASNGCAISENWGYQPIWIHGLNTECGDTGVAP